MKQVLKLNPDDYVEFMSLKEKKYWTKAEYDVPDNWWNSADYYNVPLDDFMSIIKSSIKKGYSLAIGDVSESGIMGSKGVAMIPTYDIPSAYIMKMPVRCGSVTAQPQMTTVCIWWVGPRRVMECGF